MWFIKHSPLKKRFCSNQISLSTTCQEKSCWKSEAPTLQTFAIKHYRSYWLFHGRDAYLPFTISSVVENQSCLSIRFVGLKGIYFLKAQSPFNSIISKRLQTFEHSTWMVSTKEAVPVCYSRFVSFTFAPRDIFMKVGQATGHCFCNMAELIPADNIALQVIRQRALWNKTSYVLNRRPCYMTLLPTHQFRKWF